MDSRETHGPGSGERWPRAPGSLVVEPQVTQFGEQGSQWNSLGMGLPGDSSRQDPRDVLGMDQRICPHEWVPSCQEEHTSMPNECHSCSKLLSRKKWSVAVTQKEIQWPIFWHQEWSTIKQGSQAMSNVASHTNCKVILNFHSNFHFVDEMLPFQSANAILLENNSPGKKTLLQINTICQENHQKCNNARIKFHCFHTKPMMFATSMKSNDVLDL